MRLICVWNSCLVVYLYHSCRKLSSYCNTNFTLVPIISIRTSMDDCALFVRATNTRSPWQKVKDFMKLWTILRSDHWRLSGAPRDSSKGFIKSLKLAGMFMLPWMTPARPSSQMSTRLRNTELFHSMHCRNPNTRHRKNTNTY